MATVFSVVQSFDDIDYDEMFSGSYPSIDGSFAWPDHVTTYDQKKQYYLDQINSALDGTWPVKQDDDTLFMYSNVVDGAMVEFTCGYIESDNTTLRVHWWLTHNDANGSKNVIHSTATQTERSQFLNNNGITQYYVPTIKDSTLYNWTKTRIAAGVLTLISETEQSITPDITLSKLLLEA